jgi:predicted CoA-binding protein
MDPKVQQFLNAKHIAVVGVSRSAQKFGSAIYTELKTRGYDVYAVNPAITEFNGNPCYYSLTTLQGKIDGAILCSPTTTIEMVLREAAAIGLKHIWIQQGTGSPALVKLGTSLGLKMVSGKCILMYAEPVGSIHSFHRFFAKLFGGY